MTFNLPTPPQFAGSFYKRLSRIACSSLMLLALAAPLPAVDMLYVTLTNNTIVTYDTTGNVGATIAASKATFASTNLNGPRGLAFDTSGNLYAANTGGGTSTISKFNSSGVYQSNITSNLNRPFGLAFDSSGNLYAVNTGLGEPPGAAANTISKFNSSGGYVSNITTNLSNPYGLAFDSTGNLYAANYGNNTISKFDSSGTFLTSWSTGTAPAAPMFLAFKTVTVPEPSTYALATIATGVMAYLARRRKSRLA